MPTVHCPSCRIRLSIPDGREGKAGRCPSCQSTLRVPEAKPSAPPPPLSPAPEPAHSPFDFSDDASEPVQRRSEEESEESDFDFRREPEPGEQIADKLIRSAVRWLRFTVNWGLVYCALRFMCVSFLNFQSRAPLFLLLIELVLSGLVFLPLLCLFYATNQLERRRSFGWSTVGATFACIECAIALPLVGYHFYWLCGLTFGKAWYADVRGMFIGAAFSFVFWLGTLVLAGMAGFKTIVALSNREVQKAFASRSR